MANNCCFTMRIMGEEPAVKELVQKLRGECAYQDAGIGRVYSFEVDDTKTEREAEGNRISILGEGDCAWSMLDAMLHLPINSLEEECRRLGLVVEAFSTETGEQFQEHMFINRGQVWVYDKVSFVQQFIADMPEHELAELAENYDLYVDELKEMTDDNGNVCLGGFEDDYEVFHDLFSVPEPDLELETKYLTYKSPIDGEEYSVVPRLDYYMTTNNLYVGLDYFDKDSLSMSPFADITVNISSLPYLYSTIDTNNLGSTVMQFLEENGFGFSIESSLRSGWCEYPVFFFNEQKLMEIDPVVFGEYAKVHGEEVQQKTPSLDEKIRNAENASAKQSKESNTPALDDREL